MDSIGRIGGVVVQPDRTAAACHATRDCVFPSDATMHNAAILPRHHGRILQPPYEKLHVYIDEFCQLQGASETDLTAWSATWILTPEAQQLGMLLPLQRYL